MNIFTYKLPRSTALACNTCAFPGVVSTGWLTLPTDNRVQTVLCIASTVGGTQANNTIALCFCSNNSRSMLLATEYTFTVNKIHIMVNISLFYPSGYNHYFYRFFLFAGWDSILWRISCEVGVVSSQFIHEKLYIEPFVGRPRASGACERVPFAHCRTNSLIQCLSFQVLSQVNASDPDRFWWPDHNLKMDCLARVRALLVLHVNVLSFWNSDILDFSGTQLRNFQNCLPPERSFWEGEWCCFKILLS